MKSRTLNVVICLFLPLAPEALRAGAREYSVPPARESLETTAQASDTLATGFQENAESDETKQNEEAGERADRPTRIAVVVSKDNPVKSLEAGELKRIFLRQKKVWPNGWAIAVYERHTTNPSRRQFSIAVLNKKPSELKEYWLNRKLTLGIKAPRVCRSAKLVKQYLLRVKGGIGYMYEWEVDDTVKVLTTVEIEGNEPLP